MDAYESESISDSLGLASRHDKWSRATSLRIGGQHTQPIPLSKVGVTKSVQKSRVPEALHSYESEPHAKVVRHEPLRK